MAQKAEKAAEKVENTTTTDKTKKTIADTDIFEVKSLESNVHYTCPKTQDNFTWAEVGDIQEMTYAQLKIMKNRHLGYFSKKWLYPTDAAVRKKLGITDIFAAKFSKEDRKLLYGNDVEAVKEKINYIVSEEKDELRTFVEKATKQGRITNIKIIRLLEKALGTNLIDLV